MTLSEYNYQDNHQNINDTDIFWDWHNQRIKITANQEHSEKTLMMIKKLAEKTGMGKIIAFVAPSCQELYLNQGFEVEGTIKGFFAGGDAFCFSYFLSSARRISDNRYYGIIPADTSWERVKETSQESGLAYVTRKATPADIPGMISLFRNVFATYPSPVFDEDYLGANMKYNRVIYRVALDNDNRIIGIASAEKDSANLNAEITDCVTNTQYRGQGVLSRIISELEQELYTEGYICLYTLCRAIHAPVNKAFFRLGYSYSGRLIKNCNICGSFEDMNILVKVLR